jgi:nitroimidazol reductase NimA-like FMN-containing flavoprotein (pyridoxamine 5'-phosphate oxidase superfamily)
MTLTSDRAAAAKQIIDAGRYLTLATADENGRPWVSPVGYASEDYREVLWVSSPAARHSRNLASRPEVAIVIFDSHQPLGAGQAVYLSARAEELLDDLELDRGIAIFSHRSQTQGTAAWTRSDVQPPARHRLTTPSRSSTSLSPPPTNGSSSISTEGTRSLDASDSALIRPEDPARRRRP